MDLDARARPPRATLQAACPWPSLVPRMARVRSVALSCAPWLNLVQGRLGGADALTLQPRQQLVAQLHQALLLPLLVLR